MSDESSGSRATGVRFSATPPLPRAPLLGGHGHAHGAGGHQHGTPGGGHGVPVEAGFVAGGVRRPPPSEIPEHGGRGKVLFLDCPSGIAGDMTLSALLDLGVPETVLHSVVDALELSEARLRIERGYVGALGAVHVDVLVEGAVRERSYAEIVALIERAPLPANAKTLALAIFRELGEAEAEVHRATLADVHFHEVGAVDALVDIVGAATMLDYLGATVLASPVPLGRGFVHCRHGVLPLPAPAALLCLRGVPTYDAGLEAELVTPTGAAILKGVVREFTAWPRFTPERVGLGAGTRGLPDRPNVLRAVLGSPSAPLAGVGDRTLVLCEANLDDTTPEVVAHAVARLLDAGALDAWVTPVTMKKGRPGFVVAGLASFERRADVVAAFFRESSTLGVRQTIVERSELSRRIEEIETPLGVVRVKLAGEPPTSVKPEFEDCARLARERGLGLPEVLRIVEGAIAARYFSLRR